MSYDNWIKKVCNICIEESYHTGIYPSIIIAQTILESNAGTSALAINHYNFLGITMPPKLIGKIAVFWDGTIYKRANYISIKSYADYTQAKNYDSGIVMCIRHYGMILWKTKAYGQNGVLNHISSNLSPAEARIDAKEQLNQLANIYAPRYDGNIGYERNILQIITTNNLWQYDEKFLANGGWDGKVPYSL